MVTCAIYPVRPKRGLPLPPSLRIMRGDEKYAGDIVDCLNRNNARKQFAPHWTCDSLFISSLSPSDFFLALKDGTVVGCLASWDQSAFKQTVVRGYTGSLAHWRRLLNAFSGVGGWPYLPEPNTPLKYSYASHLAVDNDDPDVFRPLLRVLYKHALEQGYGYFMIGLADMNPFRRIVDAYHPLRYSSQIYLVAWKDGLSELSHVDARLPALEIAVL
jgi:hypothetical protein